MTESPPSILSHVSLGTNDLVAATAFYDSVLGSIGVGRKMTIDGVAAAYGRAFPEFWIGLAHNQQPASVGNGVHVAFLADSREQVEAFHAAAVKAGAQDDGAPGPRPHYGEAYYGCFAYDLDGNKIEAMYWDPTLSQEHPS